MATSGNILIPIKNTGGNQLKFEWERTSVSVIENYSVIAWRLYLTTGSYGAIQSTNPKNYTITIDGKKFEGQDNINIGNDATKLLVSGAATIPHNADGTKTFSFSIYQRIDVIFSGNYITNASGSGSGTLDTISKGATLTNAPHFNDEENPTITYKNPAGEAVNTLQAALKFGEEEPVIYKSLNKTGTSYTFNFTDAERKLLRQQVVSGNSREVKIFVITTIGSEMYYSSLTRTFSIINNKPTLSPTIYDNNATARNLTGDSTGQTLIAYVSNVKVTLNPAAYKEATISGSKTVCGSHTLSGSAGTIYGVDSGLFTFSTVDSRGNAIAIDKTYSMVSYIPPTCHMTVEPPSAGGSIRLYIKGNYFNGSFGAQSNSLTVQLRYKTAGGTFGAWETLSAGKTGNTYECIYFASSGFDYRNAYVFEARATDKIQSVSYTAEPVRMLPLFDWGENDFAHHTNVILDNNTGLRSTYADGTDTQLIGINSNNNLAIGWGGYNAGIGETSVYGNTLRLEAKDKIYINNAAFGDFVVEQGEKDGWYYKKWNSGAAEAWYSATVSGIDVGAYNLDGFYYSGSKAVNFPFTFTSVIYTNASGGSTGNLNFVRPFNNTTSSMTYLVVGLADVSNATVKINLEVKGKWK